MATGLIYGAMMGAGEAGVHAGLRLQEQFSQENLLRLRAEAEQALANTRARLERETHAANVDTDIAATPRRMEAELPGKKALSQVEADQRVDVARRSPRTLPAGASEFQDGQIIATAPEKPLPKEQLAYYTAQANRFNAEAAAIRDGLKYKGKGVQLPSIKVETIEQDGVKTIVNVDQNSGAIGVVTPGEPATPGKSHWFSPDEPARPAGSPTVTWSLNGRVLPGGLSDLYPAMKDRIGPQGDQPELGKGSAARVSERPPLESFFRQGAKPPREPQQAASGRQSPPATSLSMGAEIPEAAELDAAFERRNAAHQRWQAFGLLRRRTHPKEAEAARKEFEDAQESLDRLKASYQRAMGNDVARFRAWGPQTGGQIPPQDERAFQTGFNSVRR